MEIKVKEIGSVEQKSIQEQEEELLRKHEQESSSEGGEGGGGDDGSEGGGGDDGSPDENIDLDDQKVLSFIEKKFSKKLSSLDDLFADKQESNEDLPEDVSAFYKFKKETNRGLDDFIKLNRDIDSMNDDDAIREYLLATEEGLDSDDIEMMMGDYSYDEELDDETTIKKAKIAKKKMVSQAKKYLNEQKEKYATPLESKGSDLEADEDYKAYKQYKSKATEEADTAEEKRKKFSQETDLIFGEEFKGFEFDIDGNKVSFSPASAAELKKSQSSIANFVSKFLDDKGFIKDAASYHKSLAVAMNPEKFAKFFYEQGAASTKDDTLKKLKNVNMEERKAPQATSKGDFKVKPVSESTGNGLRIKSKK